MAAISRKYLSIRYSLLPYYYTLFYKAHHDPTDINVLLPSAMVLKPLFFEFFNDPNSLSIDSQFLVGSALLVSPQLQLGIDINVTRCTYAWSQKNAVLWGLFYQNLMLYRACSWCMTSQLNAIKQLVFWLQTLACSRGLMAQW